MHAGIVPISWPVVGLRIRFPRARGDIVLLPALMISLYALSSTMDFVDAERLRSQNHAVKAHASCDPTAKNCPGAKEQLALNSH